MQFSIAVQPILLTCVLIYASHLFFDLS